MISIGTRVLTVNIAFSTPRNAALIESKMLQYTTISLKLHHCTLSELKTQVFTLSDVIACLSIHSTNHKQQSNPDLSTESPNNTLQIYGDVAEH